MNREVHYEFTRAWAIDEGFSEQDAEMIAAADWDVDRVFNVRVWRNKGYHFAWLGARRRAMLHLRRAVDDGDLVALGVALHCVQDAIGHGFWGHLWHWPGIDRWQHRSLRVRERVERESRRLLSSYLAARDETPRSADG